MTRDELEFAISQYADGTLPAAEVAALEQRLESDAEALQLLAQYRKLDDVLSAVRVRVPNVRWDALTSRITRAIDESRDAIDVVPDSLPMPWVRWAVRLAAAACIVLALGVGFRAYWLRHDASTGTTVAQAPVPVAKVAGPSVEVASAPPVVDVAIGPASEPDGEAAAPFYADGVVAHPSRIVIASGLGSPEYDQMPY